MSGAAIRSRLAHPVIDADGHIVEFFPLIRDFLAEEAGEPVAVRLDASLQSGPLRRALDPASRRAAGLSRTGWWGVPARNTLDRATAMLPRLLYERLDDIGIDLAILYPTAGLMPMALDDAELRTGLARACNRYYAECYGEFSDRLRPVGIIPTYTPDEAIAELNYAHETLGLRAFLFGGLVLRPHTGMEQVRTARWVDGLGLDSAYDYDPLWQRCVELGVSPTFHSTGIGFGSRVSPTNYVANHIGNFAAGSEAVCRSLFFGGVPRRFPTLRFAFLEGGVSWAGTLYSDILGHFAKRNQLDLQHYNPANLDRPRLHELAREYGSPSFVSRLDRLDDTLIFLSDPDEDPATLDEFAMSGITSAEDVYDVFTRQFHFGCEADDPSNALAFGGSIYPMGATFRAMFASDIGHWDVPDFAEVLDEAWELVEHGHVDEAQFADFMAGNVVSLLAGTNPAFFDGTVVADWATAHRPADENVAGISRSR
jgi:predicted TIM-barrel fold metal-dependent hydrolase